MTLTHDLLDLARAARQDYTRALDVLRQEGLRAQKRACAAPALDLETQLARISRSQALIRSNLITLTHLTAQGLFQHAGRTLALARKYAPTYCEPGLRAGEEGFAALGALAERTTLAVARLNPTLAYAFPVSVAARDNG